MIALERRTFYTRRDIYKSRKGMEMVSYDATQFALYLSLVLALAAVGLTLSLGVLTAAVVRNHRERMSRHEAMRTYDGGLALHH
jgi:ABC-type spermidine/putrescine transport system permease subunit II